MDLRRRTLLVVALLMAGIAFALYVTLHFTVIRGLASYETADAQQATIEVRADFKQEVDALQARAAALAAQPGVRNFHETRSMPQLKASLREQELAGEGIVLVVLVNGAGRPIAGLHEQQDDWETRGLTTRIESLLTGKGWPDWRKDINAHSASSFKGILKIGTTGILVAAAPLNGGGRGYLLVGKRIDFENFFAQPESFANTDLAFSWRKSVRLPADFHQAAKELEEGQPSFERILNLDTVSGYASLPTVVGGDALLVRVDIPRRVVLTSRQFAERALWVLSVSVLLAGGLLWFMLDRQILLRLTTLSKGVSQVGELADPSLRVRLSGDDEVSQLSDSINRMLSELERAQIDLRESEQRFSALSGSSFEAILIHDGNVVVEVNQALLNLFGYERKALIGERIEKLSPAYLTDSLWKLAEEAGDEPFEASGVTQSGNATPIEVRCRTMPYRGREMMVAAIRDISERKAAEAALRESEESYRRLIDLAQEGIVSCDANEMIRFCNPTFASVLGYSPGELIGRSIIDMCRPSSGERVLQESAKRHSGLTGTYEVELVTRDARTRSFHLTACPMFDAHGNYEGTLGVFTDITERKQTEQAWLAAQKAESLGVLAGGIAHDFNNLLVGIIGNVSLAIDTLPPASPVLRFLTEIDKSSQRAKELVELMLAYSGRGRLALRKVDLNRSVEETLRLMGTSVPTTVQLELDLATSLPPVDADEVMLRQMITSVLLNAFEALRNGEGRVGITTRSIHLSAEQMKVLVPTGVAGAATYCVLEVTDNGAGMDAETLDKIFDPFFSTKFAGRGLGLPAVQGIVKRHRGDLQVESEPGRGTTFRVLLPAARIASTKEPSNPAGTRTSAKLGETQPAAVATAEKAGTVLARAAEASQNGKHQHTEEWQAQPVPSDPTKPTVKRVLVIAQEATVGQVTRRILEQQQYQVDSANSGAEGIVRFTENPSGFDLVLLDLDLEDVPGLEVLAKIQAARPETALLLLTGDIDISQERELSGYRILRRPFAPALLLQEVQALS